MNKLKLLIADDEPLALRSMQILIQKEFPELEVCALAENGIEAKDAIEKNNPDLVIMDIRMPGLSGLEVIQLLKNRQKTHFIISTAYSDFDYIHTALDLKADGYLLKPAKRDETIKVIQKAITAIKEEKRQEEIRKNADYALHAVNPALEKEIIVSVAKGTPNLKQFELWKNINRVHVQAMIAAVFDCSAAGRSGIHFRPQLQADPRDGEIATEIGSSTPATVLQRMRLAMEGMGPYLAGMTEDGLVWALFLFTDSADHEERCAWTIKICRIISGETKSERISDLLANEAGSASDPGDLSARGDSTVSVPVWEKSQEFSSFSDAGKVAAQCREAVIKKREADWEDGGICDTRGYVQMAVDYIERRFRQPISLEQCAGEIGISPYYLSHVFKEEKGITFLEYLSARRMKEAKSLCGDPFVPLKEIGERCGYSNSSYFYKVFKKTEGVTVGEYRQKVLHANISEQ